MHSSSTLGKPFTSCLDGTLSSSYTPETSQVLWKQAEMHKGPEWLSSQSGSYECPGGQILHPRCLRHDRCKSEPRVEVLMENSLFVIVLLSVSVSLEGCLWICNYCFINFLSSVLRLGVPRKPSSHPENLPFCRIQSRNLPPRRFGLTGGSGRCHGHQRRQAEVYGHAQPHLLSSCMLWLSATHGRWGELTGRDSDDFSEALVLVTFAFFCVKSLL